MKITCIRQCDARVGGTVKALFPGIRYEIPDEVAMTLIKAGKVEKVGAGEGAPAPSSAPTPRKARR